MFNKHKEKMPQHSKAVPFDEMNQKELDEISKRRAGFEIELRHGEDTLGLAISGGGIRSATFSLGILQRLAELKILPQLDYLSTVSGGGFIGSWLYSWIRREQNPDSKVKHNRSEQALKDSFDSVVRNLSTKKKIEAEEIMFLRMFSNYLTPRVSVFSADTWLVAAIWARNTLLNLVILISVFASVVLFIRGAAQLGFSRNWPAQNDEWGLGLALCAGLLAPMLVLMGRNLWWNSTIALSGEAPVDRKGESSNGTVVWFCVFPIASAVAYSFWLARAKDVFVNESLWHGIRANFAALLPAFLFLQLCTRLFKCHIEKQWQIKGEDTSQSTEKERCEMKKPKIRDWLYGAFIYVVGPASAAFVTAALLRAVALVFEAAFPGNLDPQAPWFVLTFGPPMVLTVFTLGMIVHIGLMGRDLPEASREWLGRLRAWLLIFNAAWLILMGVSIYGPWLAALIGSKSQIALGTLGTGWIISTGSGLLAGWSDKTGGTTTTEQKTKAPVLEIVAAIGPYVFTAGFATAVAFGVHVILVHNLGGTPTPYHSETGFWWQYARYWPQIGQTRFFIPKYEDRWALSGLIPLLGLLVSVGGLLAWRVDINVFSMNNFYKNRLVRCYLGASRRKRNPSPFTGFDDFDDVALSEFTANKNYRGPYPIINASLNVTSGGKLQFQERQADSFIFTPLYTGFSAETAVTKMRLNDRPDGARISDGKPVRHDDADIGSERERGVPAYRPSTTAGGRVSLGMAVAISGAAVSPNMGYHTSTPISFLLTVFNVRLGWWLGNSLKKTFRNPGPAFGLKYALSELFGMANANSNYVNLSDGGHFENMGIYELVRRRCRYIICCDGEQDEGLTFGGIGNAIRKCRTDFGVEIDLPLGPLRKVDGFSSAHCVVATIEYPDGPQGYLLYLKSTLTGDEATDVLEYHSRQPDFPHQTTGDQWFDESQFESYRKLGYHIADKAVSSVPIEASARVSDHEMRETFFDSLYRIWYPPSSAVNEKAAAHADMYTRILDAVREDGSLKTLDPALFRGYDVYTEGAWEHNSGHVCNSLTQLMERVFYDFSLEDVDARKHPYVEGWLDIFAHWVHSEPFRKAWPVTKHSYPVRFRNFYDSIPMPEKSSANR